MPAPNLAARACVSAGLPKKWAFALMFLFERLKFIVGRASNFCAPAALRARLEDLGREKTEAAMARHASAGSPEP